MTENDVVTPRRRQLRDEAAHWFAAMRGPDADAQRPALDAWLAADPLHRAAYNQIAETFSLGKGLKAHGPVAVQPPGDESPATQIRPPRPGVAIAAALTAIILGALWIGPLSYLTTPSPAPETDLTRAGASATTGSTNRAIRLSTEAGPRKTFALPDGSSVRLEADSLIIVQLSRDRRALQLLRGRGRFTVAHDGRPFIVAAAGGTITARGTVFDVTLDRRNGVVVHLIEGRVDVLVPMASHQTVTPSSVRELEPGELLGFGPGLLSTETSPSRAEVKAETLHDIDRMPLGVLLAQANRSAAVPILLDTPDLADLRISGTFRTGDTHKLAENLSISLGLAVIDRGDAIVLAHDCSGKNSARCKPTS